MYWAYKNILCKVHIKTDIYFLNNDEIWNKNKKLIKHNICAENEKLKFWFKYSKAKITTNINDWLNNQIWK